MNFLRILIVLLMALVALSAPCLEIREEKTVAPVTSSMDNGLLIFCIVMSCIASVIFGVAGICWCVTRWRNFRRAYTAFGDIPEMPPADPIAHCIPVALNLPHVPPYIQPVIEPVRERRVQPPREAREEIGPKKE